MTPGSGTVAVVIGLVVMVAAVIVLWPDGDDDSGPGQTDAVDVEVPSDPDAVQIATEFVDAYSRHDADLAASYLTDEVLVSRFEGLDAFRLETRWMALTGGDILPGRCELHDTSPEGTTVRCPNEFHGLRSEELGLGRYGGNHYDLTVQDGKIVAFADHVAFLTNGFSEEVWKPFARWVAEHHPDDVDLMYGSRAMTYRRASEESNLLWEQHPRVRRVQRPIGLGCGAIATAQI
jgi:hypothetical protein